MSPSERLGALTGIVAALGVLLMVLSFPALRRRGLAERVAPFAGRVAPGLDRASARTGAWSVLWHPVASSIAERGRSSVAAAFAAISGDDAVLRRRLAASGAGEPGLALRRHRHGQLLAIVAGASLAAIILGWALLARGAVPSVAAVVLLLLGVFGGVLLHDRRLTARVHARRTRMMGELPAIAELLALAVGAGESPAAALARVARVCGGVLAEEVAAAAEAARSGTPVLAALSDLADAVDLAPLRRMVDAMVIAVDRGTPMSDVLRAQAADLRAEAARTLIEGSGRREIGMLIPVVFLVMPTVVVVALFPGWHTLSLVTR